jgi:feruloyl-CoA synthase
VCGCIGVPLPGVTLKLVPNAGRLELRVRGPNVTPGYYGDEAASASAFDEEGFYRTGDAVRLVDADDPGLGLLFDGRLAENFKLTSGTWVTVGAVRTGLVSAAGGVLSDAVIAGHDREYVAALGWVDQDAAGGVCGIAGRGGVALDDQRLREHLSEALARHNAGAGSAGRVLRLLLLEEPPDLDAGEVTDKRYVNQRVALERRAADVQRLFADPPGPEVILPRG